MKKPDVDYVLLENQALILDDVIHQLEQGSIVNLSTSKLDELVGLSAGIHEITGCGVIDYVNR